MQSLQALSTQAICQTKLDKLKSLYKAYSATIGDDLGVIVSKETKELWVKDRRSLESQLAISKQRLSSAVSTLYDMETTSRVFRARKERVLHGWFGTRVHSALQTLEGVILSLERLNSAMDVDVDGPVTKKPRLDTPSSLPSTLEKLQERLEKVQKRYEETDAWWSGNEEDYLSRLQTTVDEHLHSFIVRMTMEEEEEPDPGGDVRPVLAEATRLFGDVAMGFQEQRRQGDVGEPISSADLEQLRFSEPTPSLSTMDEEINAMLDEVEIQAQLAPTDAREMLIRTEIESFLQAEFVHRLQNLTTVDTQQVVLEHVNPLIEAERATWEDEFTEFTRRLKEVFDPIIISTQEKVLDIEREAHARGLISL